MVWSTLKIQGKPHLSADHSLPIQNALVHIGFDTSKKITQKQAWKKPQKSGMEFSSTFS